MLAMTRDLLRVRENYNVYYRCTAMTYRAKSPIGDPPHLHKLVWAWSLYCKLGTSGALSAKWSGPWKIVRFSPPALLVIQTTWLGITGRREVCREIVIDKLKLFQQSPDNLKECQLEPEEIPEEDTDKEAVQPFVDPKDSRARINHIQCKSDVLSPEDVKEVVIYKDKDGDWGIGMSPADLRPCQQDDVGGGY